MRRTFLDANVLIALSAGEAAAAARAMDFVNDPDREFVTSDPLWLETLPVPTYNGHHQQVQWLQAFFENAVAHGVVTHNSAQSAKTLALRHGLGGVDALHVQAALDLGAEEFVSLERRNSPLARVTEMRVTLVPKGGATKTQPP